MAVGLNKVLLIGRLGVDPKLSYLPSGSPVANFRMATDESYRDRQTGDMVDKAEWHNVVVYGKPAEFCGNYLGKGNLVYVEGTLRTRKWQDRDGNDRYTTEVVVDFKGRIQGLERGNRDNAGQGNYNNQQRQYNNQGNQQGGQQNGQQGGWQQAQPQQQGGGYPQDDDLGPAFPSEAGGMDDVPF